MNHSGVRISLAACLASVLCGWAALPGQAASRPAVPGGGRPLPALLSRAGLAASANQELDDVTATSARNAWVIGQKLAEVPFTFHWNGAAWSRVAIPHPAANGIAGITATSPSNAWAAGLRCTPGCAAESTLILHWNGTAWSRLPSLAPRPGHIATLSDVSASSAGNAWAVGSTCSIATSKCLPLTLHWNGKSWTQVAIPVSGASRLNDVTATSVSNAWAVGDKCGTTCTASSLILHWNGTTWSRVATPNPGANGTFFGVSATAPGDAWAAGTVCATTTRCPLQTFIVHWNGTAWTRVMSPNSGSQSALNAIAAVSASDAWAVGANCSNTANKCNPIILRWNGKTWAKTQLSG
jgi:hypothetical protein